MNPKTIFSFLFILLISAAGKVGAGQDVINKSFTAKPGDTLFMKVDRGSIKIVTSNTDKVDIEVVREVKRASESAALEVLEKHKIEFSQEGNKVLIEAENPQTGLGFLKQNPFKNLQVEYTVTVPARFDLDLHTAGGNIEIDDLEGQVKAHTSGGNLQFGTIKGEINAQTSGGNIEVKGGKGKARVQTSGGDLKIGAIEGDLVAKTSGGSIVLDRVKGYVDAHTSGGDIRVNEAFGPIKASTSGGNVSAELSEQPSGDSSLRTSGGNVEVTLADKVAVDLDAHTSGGQVTSEFSGEFNKQRTKLIAKVNGGGPELILETSGGNVDVRKK